MRTVFRLNNNIPSYKELLADLCKSLDAALPLLRPLIRGGGIEEALRRLHGLKGISGNLGAISLSQVFQKIETALATSREREYEILITRMEQTIQQNLAAITAFINSEERPVADSPRAGAADENLLFETMDLLACLLEQGRLDAVDVFKKLKRLVRHRHSHPAFNNLAAAMECLDYTNARKELDILAASMNIAL